MEDLSQENITTRSILKNILQSEQIRSPSKHRAETRNPGNKTLSPGSHQPRVKIHNVASPAMVLRSKLKASVRRSVGMPSGSGTRKSSRIKPRQSPKNPNIEDLDKITPRSLLRKIIQNEPEVSLIVSQKSIRASEHMEQDPALKSSISRTSKIDLGNHTLAESMHQERKGGLIRRPKKLHLVSLEDFEQGVENKYLLLKGSQDCFVESTEEDLSDASSNEVARMSTEFYSHTGVKDKSIARASPQPEPGREDQSILEAKRDSLNQLSKSNFELRKSSVSAPEISQGKTDKSLPWVEGHKSHTSRIEESEHLQEENNSEEVDVSMQPEAEILQIKEAFGSYVEEAESAVADLEMKRPSSSTGKRSFQQKSIERRSIKKYTSAESLNSEEPHHSPSTHTRSSSPQSQELLDSFHESMEVHIQHASGTVADELNVDSIDETVQPNKEEEPHHSPSTHTRSSSPQSQELLDSFHESMEVHIQHASGTVADELNVDSIDETVQPNKGESLIRKPNIPIIQTKEALLTNTPNFMKNVKFRTEKQVSVKRPQKKRNVVNEKKKAPLPGSFIKQTFCHYAQSRVSKECFKEVEKCLELYFEQVSNDLAAYTAHANRKTITKADIELLLRRQGLVTDNIPLNVLIEKHLPLEYRKLLIPCATSGNKVFPTL
uniref:CENP-T/Histone H4 histone fold domain-containing protein n=1 Tax=Leptobrachium leishanense TaxID=445787 RepID=A0A8C5MWP0_9ANUR